MSWNYTEGNVLFQVYKPSHRDVVKIMDWLTQVKLVEIGVCILSIAVIQSRCRVGEIRILLADDGRSSTMTAQAQD